MGQLTHRLVILLDWSLLRGLLYSRKVCSFSPIHSQLTQCLRPRPEEGKQWSNEIYKWCRVHWLCICLCVHVCLPTCGRHLCFKFNKVDFSDETGPVTKKTSKIQNLKWEAKNYIILRARKFLTISGLRPMDQRNTLSKSSLISDISLTRRPGNGWRQWYQRQVRR